ncbi:MAG: glycosyltransferase [Candidatus Saelkia tenebricola]|nr:glycosyltransferase [Candidatus Saelkia tenebricola]
MNLKNYEIIFITRESKVLPGARYRAYNFSNCLQKQGYTSCVLSFSENLGALSGNLESFLTIADKIKYNKKAYTYLKQFKNPLLIIQRLNYHSFGPLFYAFKNKIKYIYDIDDWEFRENITPILGFLPKSKAEFIFKITAKKALFNLAGSNFLYNYIKNITPRVFYLAPGIEIEHFKIKQNHMNKKITILAWIGTMFRHEDFINLQWILEIVKDIPNIQLEIIGDGIWKSNIQDEAKKEGIKNVTFKGWITPSDIPRYLDNVDIGIFPIAIENKFTEAKFPVKILEFMAKGIPVIATSFGETQNIINDGVDGLLAKNKEEFKGSILKLAGNSSLRKKIGANAREKIENNYTVENQTQKLISILKDV